MSSHEPVSLSPIVEAIGDVVQQLRDIGDLDDARSENERRRTIAILEHVRGIVEGICEFFGGSFILRWPRRGA